ncbi:MAG: membrane protein insertion efficiency factor YidD [Oscillospiraceae bacterium]|nr:membrane protein insertion efficiency factor YidD [Oscillospiraceae bacterium]
MKYVFIGLIKLYQATLSKILPPVCRFTPCCSAYAVTAFERFGTVKGGYLTIRRLLRCHPWNPGGYDPVDGN